MNDAFSVNNTNAKLDYPVGLMTIDELSYAGGKSWTKLTAPYVWYYTNANGESITCNAPSWSLSPRIWYGTYSSTNVWRWNDSYYLGSFLPADVVDSIAVRPSVSLLSCNLISRGDGSPKKPYVVYTGSGVCE